MYSVLELFLGHAHPLIQNAISEQASRGTHFFAYLNEQAIQFATRLKPIIRCSSACDLRHLGQIRPFTRLGSPEASQVEIKS